MDRDRHEQLSAENEEDLAEARRQGHKGWEETYTGRRASLRKIRPGSTDEADKPTFRLPTGKVS